MMSNLAINENSPPVLDFEIGEASGPPLHESQCRPHIVDLLNPSSRVLRSSQQLFGKPEFQFDMDLCGKTIRVFVLELPDLEEHCPALCQLDVLYGTVPHKWFTIIHGLDFVDVQLFGQVGLHKVSIPCVENCGFESRR